MITAQILTPWIGSGIFDDSYRPRIIDDYPDVAYVDITGHPSENITPYPNLFICVITCTPETLELIEADLLYKVIWSEAQ